MNQPQHSSIFLSNVTLIDAAFIDQSGRAHGISVSPTLEVRGAVVGDEQVVVDFSACRKRLKALIDDKLEGYDHKLWVDANYTDVKASKGKTPDLDTLRITTPHFDLGMPRNACRMINLHATRATAPSIEALLENVADDMSAYLTRSLSEFNVVVTVQLNVQDGVDTTPTYGIPEGYVARRIHFSYTHGLPHSSSWGCQNILHGHTSFIDLVHRDEAIATSIVDQLVRQIRMHLDASYIYDKAHAKAVHNGDTYVMGHAYKTERGSFCLEFSAASDVHQIGLDVAPTIENIVEYVAHRFDSSLQMAQVRTIAVSEGLWKGALIHCADHQWMKRHG